MAERKTIYRWWFVWDFDKEERRSEYGGFDIMSDIDSKLTHLSRIYKMLIAIGVLNLLIGIMNSINLAGRYGWINLLCSTLIMYGAGRIKGRIDYLENERLLRE